MLIKDTILFLNSSLDILSNCTTVDILFILYMAAEVWIRNTGNFVSRMGILLMENEDSLTILGQVQDRTYTNLLLSNYPTQDRL